MKENYSLWEKVIILVATVLIIWGIVYLITKYKTSETQTNQQNTEEKEEIDSSTEEEETSEPSNEDNSQEQAPDLESIPI
ncbi:hypothetical protein ACFL14_01770 [Patescibacteria group bacterium]